MGKRVTRALPSVRAIARGLALSAAALMSAGLAAQTIEPPFNSIYTFADLGTVPGLPSPAGGLTFLAGNPNVLLIGGAANTASGNLYSIGVVRNASNQVTGFSGTATFFAQAAFNDGGVVYGPGGVLFLSRWPSNELGQTKPGSTITDKIIALAPFGVASANAALNFVPAGFPGAGQFKLVSWSGGEWYTATLAPDATGTFDVTSVVSETTITGGPEGFIYVPPGSPLFTSFNSMLVSEYSANSIATYQLDANGDPVPATRVLFMSGLTGAEGATIDPLTGDFLFSTFGGGDRVLVVRGFAQPATPTPTPTGTIVATATPTATATSTLTPTFGQGPGIPTNIPTLSPAMLALLAVGLAMLAIFVLRRGA